MASASEINAQQLNRKKILYVQLNTSSFAGIERVLDAICTQLASKYGEDLEIDVLYTSYHKDRPSEPRAYNTIDRPAKGRIGLMRAYRDVIGSKDYSLVVVPQIEPTVISMVSCFGLSRKFALYLHGNPYREGHHLRAKILFRLMKSIYLSRVACVFGISTKQIDAFNKLFDSNTRHKLLPNPVRHFEVKIHARGEDPAHITFVNVGRFDTQKGQDILLEAFSRVLRVRNDVRLKLVGYGSTEGDLRTEIARLDIEPFVAIEHHPGDPTPALSVSDIYVSTSRWEGFGLAMCEALRFGLPVVATDCEFGPSEILVDPRLGRLVAQDDMESLVNAMLYYCSNLLQERAHAQFRQDYVDKYSPERVVDLHAEALLDTIENAANTRGAVNVLPVPA